MVSGLLVREMQPEDLAFAVDCTASEGWQSEDYATFEGFFVHDPQGCFLAEQAGQPVGICVATTYEKSGFVGELVVHPNKRGQGVGTVLLNHAVNYLWSLGVKTIYLDGVVKAIPLYERNGFRKVCRSLRFFGSLPGRMHTDVRPMEEADLAAVCSFDMQAFGEDRGYFLARRWQLYPELCKVMIENGKLTGYITGRRNQSWAAAGPWVAVEGASNPQYLLESLACQVEGATLSIGVLESNRVAVELVRSMGFEERVDSPWRMALGPSNGLGASIQCLAVGTAAKG
jgi:ribosomal protein S18 acetylase RimI-like enzyme